jgi:hypothetical protein
MKYATPFSPLEGRCVGEQRHHQETDEGWDDGEHHKVRAEILPPAGDKTDNDKVEHRDDVTRDVEENDLEVAWGFVGPEI